MAIVRRGWCPAYSACPPRRRPKWPTVGFFGRGRTTGAVSMSTTEIGRAARPGQ